LETTYKRDWELPGGVIEPGESPREGLIREIAEELGIHLAAGAPALVDWMPQYLGWSDAIEFIFDLGTLEESQHRKMRPDAEIRAFHWVEPTDVGDHVTELSRRRIALLLRGYRGHTEAGYPLASG
ncbi:MAG: NUDIX hydrolase, partial [Propionibacteriaceae bacterium]|nr:NUDIX hydrolase [Propionibacteriaceae bacterium]